MRFPLAFHIVLILPFPTSVSAADINGYTAQYECRAGNPNCNVDVATLVAQTCQQTITTDDSASTINSKINGGSQYICVRNGDYTSKGKIMITASGTSSARKVLRYTRDLDNDDEPWKQVSNDQAATIARSSSKVGLANRGVPDHGRGSRRLCNHAT